jgi:hypothetical protein
MSAQNSLAAREILDNLLKSKTELKNLRSQIIMANSDITRLSNTLMQLARGDPTGLIVQLAQMGPVGVKLALGVAAVTVAYGIYRQLTKEQPTEMYFWRQPT